MIGHRNHKVLTNGVGSCSVPMYIGDFPCFCNDAAYGIRPECKEYRRGDGSLAREDGRYDGYVPALACPGHGGPFKKEALNLCDHCVNEIATCKSNPSFGCGKGNDNVFECDLYESKGIKKDV